MFRNDIDFDFAEARSTPPDLFLLLPKLPERENKQDSKIPIPVIYVTSYK